MTNREWIDNLSNEQLAKYLSEWISCGNCPVNSSCGDGLVERGLRSG